MDENKEYYAFISYKSDDTEWAIWLQHELEHYHLPASLNGRGDIRQDLRPVFRDIDELSAGNLPEQIRAALAKSANLIVICSPMSAKSPWVNKEVETFISMGKTDHIFPFIVEGNTPQDFFPPAILDLPKDEERLGGDVTKNGRDAAFIKVVAGMLGIGFDTLWDRYEREKAEEERRQREQKEFLLTTQSFYLAEKSASVLLKGDAMLAMRLALEGLPRDMDNPSRPYVIEAERALRLAFRGKTYRLASDDRFIMDACCSSDGCRILTAGSCGIEEWSLDSGALLRIISRRKNSSFPMSVIYSPDGGKIAAYFDDSAIGVWNWKTGRRLFRRQMFKRGELDAIDPDIKHLFFYDNNTIVARHTVGDSFMVDANTGEKKYNSNYHFCWEIDDEIMKANGRAYRGIVKAECGESYLDQTTAKSIVNWLHSNGFQGEVSCVSIGCLPDDTQAVAVAGKDGVLSLWSLREGRCIDTLKTGWRSTIRNVFLCPKSKIVAYGLGREATVIWRPFYSQFEIPPLPLKDGIRNNSSLITANGQVWIIFSERIGDGEKSTNTLMNYEKGMITQFEGYSIWNADISPDATMMAYSTWDEIKLYELATGKETLLSNDACGKLFFSADGTLLVSFTSPQKPSYDYLNMSYEEIEAIPRIKDENYLVCITIWDVKTGTLVEKTPVSPLQSCVGKKKIDKDSLFSDAHYCRYDVSADKSCFVVYNWRYVALWSMSTINEIARIDTLAFDLTKQAVVNPYVSLAPDNSTVALIMYKGEITLCDIFTKEVNNIPVGDITVNHISFSHDCKYLATIGHDGVVRVWDIEKKLLLDTLVGPSEEAEVVLFSEDGRYIYVGYNKHPIVRWQWTPLQELIDNCWSNLSLRTFTPEEKEKYHIL